MGGAMIELLGVLSTVTALSGINVAFLAARMGRAQRKPGVIFALVQHREGRRRDLSLANNDGVAAHVPVSTRPSASAVAEETFNLVVST